MARKSKIKSIVTERFPNREPVAEPKPEKPLIALPVFLTICGLKMDQTAGFRYYATHNGMGPLSVEDWRIAYKEFMKKPTK